MNAIELIKDLREQSFMVKADGDYLELSPPERITEDLIKRLLVHKPEILAELKREARSKKVLDMLADKPNVQSAIRADLDSDPHNVILAIAFRDQCTFEMQIPLHRYDYLALFEMIHVMDKAIELTQ